MFSYPRFDAVDGEVYTTCTTILTRPVTSPLIRHPQDSMPDAVIFKTPQGT